MLGTSVPNVNKANPLQNKNVKIEDANMVKTKGDNRITFNQNVVCGTIAAFSGKTLTAPLDVIKIRAQIGAVAPKLSKSRGGWLLPTIKYIFLHEGPRAFWKGNFIGCLRVLPYSTVQLAAFQRLKLQLSDDCGRLTPWTAMVAGAGGGVIATAVMYPSDTVKSRLIAQSSPHKHYNGIYDACTKMAKEEKLYGFYRGLSTTFLGTTNTFHTRILKHFNSLRFKCMHIYFM